MPCFGGGRHDTPPDLMLVASFLACIRTFRMLSGGVFMSDVKDVQVDGCAIKMVCVHSGFITSGWDT